MASTECGNGHIYDPDIYPSCPYCNNENIWVNIGNNGGGRNVVDPNETQKTMPGNGYNPMQNNMPYGGGSMVGDAGKTMPPKGYKDEKNVADDDRKTEAVIQKKMNIVPVAGWLVCIEGKEKGKDYRLLSKINFIGRSEKNDVCIKGDTTISKENHARIAYEDKHNNYTLIPAESINNIYLNDQPIYVPTVLKAYDVIEIGETKLVFIPLCSDRFNWNDLVKDDKE